LRVALADTSAMPRRNDTLVLEARRVDLKLITQFLVLMGVGKQNLHPAITFFRQQCSVATESLRCCAAGES
jgi:hypothetical protein